MTADPATVAALPGAAMRAAVLKALLDEVKKAYDAARAQADTALLHLHSTVGVRTVEVRLPGAIAPIAQITVPEASAGLRVDEQALLDYCAREHPGEIEQIPAKKVVRPAWRKTLLARLSVEPDGTVVDSATGRVLDFIEVRPAAAPMSTTMTFKDHGRDTVAASHREGRLSLPELLQGTAQ
ncbi:hypothetical protein [Couchioplanes caeruleus]|uniref:Uncharacterized protein n=2 Tax=Couchioplanes caeruleus TaxID=56438 RepID=A0A1K0H0Z7_9ACTN|nr:hypothetical protein [Couchioplanes caeruleus]OJF15379.1 hypothetical protein BG844_04570 [Couchioplanes caeruleus subsp. caeruleus]ROP33418.1 hypothetical protein EDD30_6397 [Couchioplanes caeruleus]